VQRGNAAEQPRGCAPTQRNAREREYGHRPARVRLSDGATRQCSLATAMRRGNATYSNATERESATMHSPCPRGPPSGNAAYINATERECATAAPARVAWPTMPSESRASIRA
jgi:hypothetical protein